MSENKGKIYSPTDLESLVFKWGVQQWLIGEKVSMGMTLLFPKTLHSRHSHPDVEQIVYIISGTMRLIFYKGSKEEEYIVNAGSYIHIPPGQEHAGEGVSVEPVKALVVYGPPGPETHQLRNSKECEVLPPGRTPKYG